MLWHTASYFSFTYACMWLATQKFVTEPAKSMLHVSTNYTE